MANHTPGPWAVEGIQPDIVSASGRIAFLAMPSDGWGSELPADETTHANARLIAAAPDMLDALRLCADVLDGTRGVGERPSFINIDGARILARAAIAKATGEEAGRVETREESIQRLAAALKEAADA